MTTVKTTRAPHPPTKLPNRNNGMAHITSWPFAPDGYIPNSVIRNWSPSQEQPQPQPPKRKPVNFIRETRREVNGWLPIIGVPQNQRLHHGTTIKVKEAKDGSSYTDNASSIDSIKMEESENKCLELPMIVPQSQLITAPAKNSAVRELRKVYKGKRAVPQTQQISTLSASSVKHPNKMEESKNKLLIKLPKIVTASQHSEDLVKKPSSIRAFKKMEEDTKVVPQGQCATKKNASSVEHSKQVSKVTPQTLLLRRKNASSIGESKNEAVKKGSSPVIDRPRLQDVSLPKIPGRESNTPKLPKIVPHDKSLMATSTFNRKPISPLIYLYRRAKFELAA